MRGRRWLLSLFVISFVAACDRRLPTYPEQIELPPPGEFITNLVIPTYDGSGQTVHPDVAMAPEWWSTRLRYLAITPYPGGDAHKENPSLFASPGIVSWAVPRDAPNPIVVPNAGHLSDPDVVFDPKSSELWVYYRQVAGANIIRLMRSADAVSWSKPVTVVEGPSHTIVSPSVVRMPGGDWMMWSINSGFIGCGASSTTVELRRSPDGIAWGKPVTVDMPPPPSSLMPWHIDVQWIPSRFEFWAVYNAKDQSSCGTTALYIATSPDGMHWTTHPRPLLIAGQVAELATIVYRSTFEFDPTSGDVTFWYSGARSDGRHGYHWSTISQRMSAASMFEQASAMAKSAPITIPPGVRLVNPP